ncbi:unnamed protein product [Arctia plantaginis]|uniref:Uncharacterized protein n=1 Tax=Arctia plantaginis TaxID=874455 RepID=A0A8S1B7L8_ARCPL|nr:unnamed protein product [Arctia plantaginis]CAB3254338.1 unnamed protein product [Arctia plantaginis]
MFYMVYDVCSCRLERKLSLYTLTVTLYLYERSAASRTLAALGPYLAPLCTWRPVHLVHLVHARHISHWRRGDASRAASRACL